MRVLIVEDDPSIALVQQEALERDGFDVTVSGTGRGAVALADSWGPDLVILDQVLPDIDGREVIALIRSTSRVPIMMVTAKTEEMERVAGLEAGADDYVLKPFSTPELLARAHALIRRAGDRSERTGTLTFADLELDQGSRRLRRGDTAIELTRIEFDLLRMLMQQPGTVVSRQDVARGVWSLDVAAIGKALDVHMSALRRKLGDDAKDPRYIETVRGVGFRLADRPVR